MTEFKNMFIKIIEQRKLSYNSIKIYIPTKNRVRKLKSWSI